MRNCPLKSVNCCDTETIFNLHPSLNLFLYQPIVHPSWLLQLFSSFVSLSKLIDDWRNQFRSATRLFLLFPMDLVTRILCVFTMKGNVIRDRSRCDLNKNRFRKGLVYVLVILKWIFHSYKITKNVINVKICRIFYQTKIIYWFLLIFIINISIKINKILF